MVIQVRRQAALHEDVRGDDDGDGIVQPKQRCSTCMVFTDERKQGSEQFVISLARYTLLGKQGATNFQITVPGGDEREVFIVFSDIGISRFGTAAVAIKVCCAWR